MEPSGHVTTDTPGQSQERTDASRTTVNWQAESGGCVDRTAGTPQPPARERQHQEQDDDVITLLDRQLASETRAGTTVDSGRHVTGTACGPEILMLSSTKCKPLLIQHHISWRHSQSSETVIGWKGDSSIVLKTGSNKVKLDSVTPSQWIAANGCIMSSLIESGQIRGQQILDYIAYAKK